MSRGPGQLQRSIVRKLDAAKDQELPIRELRRSLGNSDRSNFRRAIRGLLERDMIEEIGKGVGSRVKLAMRGRMAAYAMKHLSKPRPDPRKELRRKRNELWREFVEAKWESQRLRREKAARYPQWLSYERRSGRKHGLTQLRILAALWYCADPLDAGLPVRTVKAIVGGEKANTRRAIRNLILRGDLDQTPDGERIRLSEGLLDEYWKMMVPAAHILLMLVDPIDEDEAWEIVRKDGEELPVVFSGGYDRQNGPNLAWRS